VTRLATGNQKGILGEAASLSIGVVLAALAAARRGKAFHPDGVVRRPPGDHRRPDGAAGR
jgi:hypothetical protein